MVVSWCPPSFAVISVVVGEIYVVHKQRKVMRQVKEENDDNGGDHRDSRDFGKERKKFGMAGVASKMRPSTAGGSGRSLELSSMALVRDETTMEFVPDIRTLKTEVRLWYRYVEYGAVR
jgi:hypothetical protein